MEYYPFVLTPKEIKILYKFPPFKYWLRLRKFWVTKHPIQKVIIVIVVGVCIVNILQFFGVIKI